MENTGNTKFGSGAFPGKMLGIENKLEGYFPDDNPMKGGPNPAGPYTTLFPYLEMQS